MFEIGLVDHVRLSLDGVQAAYEGHADAAARLARLSSHARLGTLGASALAAALAGIATQQGPIWHTAAAIVSALAFATCAAYVGFNQQPRIYGHRVSAARLWVVCEKYRALMAEMHAGLLDLPAIHDRRNALLQEAATVFEQTAPDDRYTFEIAKRALRGAAGPPGPAHATVKL